MNSIEKRDARSGENAGAAFPACCWLALLAVCLTYANSFQNSFHFDDFHTITDNPAVRSLRNIPRFFTDAATFSVLPSNRTYRPVVSTSLALDYAFGRGYGPLPFHISTFCWFLVLLWLLFRLYRTLFARTGAGVAARWLALVSAAWFGLHPAMAETVNYIIQRGDLYCTLGCVAALGIYADFPSRRKTGLYLLPLVLALLSKPPAAVFPALLLFFAYFFDSSVETTPRLRWKRSVLASLPSLAVVGVLLALQSAMTPRSFTPSILSAADYRLTQPYVWLRYCVELFLPIHLNVDTDLSSFSQINGRVLLGMVFLLALLAAIAKTARLQKFYPVVFGLIWFVVTQLPTSLYPLSEVENDHRMFFSFAGIIPAVVWGMWLLAQRWMSVKAEAKLRPLLAAWVAVLLLAYAWGAHVRNAVWHDEETLWRDDVEKSPHNGRGLMIYGLTQMNKGAYQQALGLYTHALIYTPNYATLEINLGIVHGLLGNQAEAEHHFQRAVTLQPGDDTTHTYYGRWLTGQGRLKEAVEQLRTAVALNPQRVLPWQLLIAALRENGDLAAAQQAADEMAATFPGSPSLAAAAMAAPLPQDTAAWINRSLAQYRDGAYADSIMSAKHALHLDPKSAAAYNNLGAAYGAMEQWDEAVKDEQQALTLDPTLQIARNNLAAFRAHRAVGSERNGQPSEIYEEQARSAADWVNRSLLLNQQGKYEESIAAAQAALRIDPLSAEAWNNIAADDESLRAWDKAIEAAQKAIALRPGFQLAKNNLIWSEQQKQLGR